MATVVGTFTWTGATSSAWSNSGNWGEVTGSQFPFTTTTAYFEELFQLTSSTNNPVVVSSSVVAGAVSIGSGVTVDLQGGGSLNATSAGVTAGAGGTFTMTGGTVNMVSGTSLSYYTLTVGSGAAIIGAGSIKNPSAVPPGGTGTATLSTSGTGYVEASGGTLTISGATSGTKSMTASGSFEISGTGTLQIGNNAVLAHGSNINFLSSGGTLENTGFSNFTSNTYNATLYDMQYNNVSGNDTGASIIELVGVSTVSSAKIVGTTLQLVSGGTTYNFNTSAATLAGVTLNTSTTLSSGNLVIWLDQQPCYAAGTRILTEHGEVPVEQLAEGDQVVIFSGDTTELRRVKWVGNRYLNLRQHPQPNLAAPIRIRRDAFDTGMPARDLLLSPDHALFVDGKLIPAKYLVNGMTVVQELDAPSVHYYHVELEQHAVILAEGLPAESYLDTGNRAMFANGGQALVLHPDFAINARLHCWETDACAPLTISQEGVNPVWDRLAARAEALGHQRPERAVTTEPALQLIVDGRPVKPLRHGENRYVFTLPAGTSSLHLVSRSGVPSELLPYPNDWRRLGVAIRRIVARDSAGVMEIPADHPALAGGWYQAERDGSTMWRWTNGDAVLPITMTDGPGVVEIELGCTTVYPSDTPQAGADRLAA